MDQTRIETSGPASAEVCPSNSLLVHDDGHRRGILLFTVSSRSKRPVEVTRIEVGFPSSLQLLDPGGSGFFKTDASLDPDLPFQVSWDGRELVRRGVQLAFAMSAHFPTGSNEYGIRLTVLAHRERSATGGFRFHGRSRVTTKRYRLVLTQQPILGYRIGPKDTLTTSQPFLTEGAMWAKGGQGPVVAHEIFDDGTTSSKQIDLPGP
jgi:hypothetical protein